jgi:hypothetical protein
MQKLGNTIFIEGKMENNNDLFLKLLNGANELSRKLLSDNGDFYPLFFYYKKDKAVSSTIYDENFSIKNVDEFLTQISKEYNVDTYVFIVNDIENSAFLVSAMLNNLNFTEMYIGYKFYNNQFVFSQELLTFDELLIWQNTELKK